MYISIDGNNIGKVLEKYIFLEDLSSLSMFSKSLNNTIDYFTQLIINTGGTIVISGGDNIMASFSDDSYKDIVTEVLKTSIKDVRFSIGIGETVVHSYLALKCAKAINSNSTIYYDGKEFHL